jgi:hypothetical protein
VLRDAIPQAANVPDINLRIRTAVARSLWVLSMHDTRVRGYWHKVQLRSSKEQAENLAFAAKRNIRGWNGPSVEAGAIFVAVTD